MIGVKRRHRIAAPLVGLGTAALCACATTQRIALDCVPREVTVYVDGRLYDGDRDAIELSTDEHHTLYFKSGLYRSQMVVLESEEDEEGRRLAPADLCTHVVFSEVRPEVQFEIEPDISSDAP